MSAWIVTSWAKGFLNGPVARLEPFASDSQIPHGVELYWIRSDSGHRTWMMIMIMYMNERLSTSWAKWPYPLWHFARNGLSAKHKQTRSWWREVESASNSTPHARCDKLRYYHGSDVCHRPGVQLRASIVHAAQLAWTWVTMCNIQSSARHGMEYRRNKRSHRHDIDGDG